ncbi:UDP-N-acetylmuramoyl-tripeptide--D-alanyl-D-alanine ligase [Maridesulfovibrio salexigens]|uniref:UDP-N-acetylmuramoyl-tripeptide--D-alanyl-D-alanine ligase n=1 Tax=Maridesulfovibrio salexigens (strain ATCC 14822 / DSM 2638 / NCIMB 8403 / VKM B-1763) TaxID=526222 RepID=C6BYH0_MARSD|nr:UDP-N-acetylmuramoyl-tripeptide--D-alanyl-D-alanine ligase [Maridesulfovibrio salexigens]ACS78761.1 UDP-N-acetylmuramoylalanyl-D-glutamyl-2,6-diaminopimelate/D-alanyl-D-alanyl ligase [Maridesulfovibrio salexigens DSM 2638]
MKLTLCELEEQLMGSSDLPSAADIEIAAVRIDSRLVKKGDVFFCIEGENFDGHNFVQQAFDAGAVAVVVSQFMPEFEDKPTIMVKDTVQALGRVAAYWRMKSHARMIAVTGSAGKTTVKEMLAHVLSGSGSVHKNFMNLNNQLGLPLSMLEATGEETYWVMELGISLPHDMGELGPIAQPDMAIVHNIGPAHLEGLGSLENVADQKSSLFKYIRPEGVALCCKDHELLWEAANKISKPVPFSSQDENAEYYSTLLHTLPDGSGRFLIKAGEETAEVILPTCGSHFAENAAAVTCAAHQLGMELTEIAERLATVELPKQRFHCHTHGKWTLIDDSYNANPLSMNRAIDTAKRIADDRPLVLVLGDMLELGEEAGCAHCDLGSKIAETKPDATFYHGKHYSEVASQTNGSTLVPVKQPIEFLNGIHELGLSDAVVLFKGSRSCHMEDYFYALNNDINGENEGDKA